MKDIVRYFGSVILATAIALSVALLMPDKLFPAKAVPFKVIFDSTVQKNIVFQVFYTLTPKENFNEKHSAKFSVSPGSRRVLINIQEPHISRFRFDFGGYPGEVTIKNLQLAGSRTVAFSNFDKFSFNNHIQKYEKNNGVLTIQSDTADPFIVYKGDLNINAPEKREFLVGTLLICLLWAVSLKLILFFIGLNREKGLRYCLGAGLSFGFLVLITIPVVGNLFFNGLQNDMILKTDNRRVTQYKHFALSRSGVKDYFKNIDSMMTDRLLYKDLVVKNANEYLSDPYLFFKTDLSKAVIGVGGFVFLGNNYAKVIDRHYNPRRYGSPSTKNLVNFHTKVSEKLNSYGADYFVLVAPDKHVVYAENFPDWVKQISTPEDITAVTRTKITDLRKAGVNVVYPLTALLAAKKQATRLYYKTDTHWNHRGASEGFHALISAIEKDGKSFRESAFVRSPKYQLKEQPNARFGDLGHIAGLSSSFKVDDVRYEFLSSQKVQFSNAGAPVKEVPIQSSASSGANGKWYGHVFNKDAPNHKKVLVLCDSFMTAASLFFNVNFSEVRYASKNHPQGRLENILAIIDEMKPDLVVYETVERGL